MKDIGDALGLWAENNSREPERTYAWVCSMCLNQHRFEKDLTPDELSAEFGPRVTSIGRITPMFDTWQATGYVSRAWCLFELYTAICKRSSVAVNIVMTQHQRDAFLSAIQKGGYSAVDDVLEQIKSENTTASRPADVQAIRGVIQGLPGGFDALDVAVKQHLAAWFESIGTVRSAARLALSPKNLSDSSLPRAGAEPLRRAPGNAAFGG